MENLIKEYKGNTIIAVTMLYVLGIKRDDILGRVDEIYDELEAQE